MRECALKPKYTQIRSVHSLSSLVLASDCFIMSTQPFLNACASLVLDLLHIVKVLLFDSSLYLFTLVFKNEENTMLRYYSGKTVLITGASSGLGKEMALQLSLLSIKAPQPINIVLSARNVSLLELIATSCRELSPLSKIMVVPLDLSTLLDEGKGSSLDKYMSALTDILEKNKLGAGIDVLLNNAGVSSRGLALDTSSKVLRDVMNVNFFGPVALTRSLIPRLQLNAELRQMKNKTPSSGGSRHVCAIGIVSSVQGRVGIPQRTSYASSKHALQGYFDSVRGELYQMGISVTVISPGYINTSLSQNAITANGVAYGKTDETTKNGMNASWAAKKTLHAVSTGIADYILADAKTGAAVQARAQFPTLLNAFTRNKK